mmetsp:Transcript_8942/g.18957  ORF Transcript_8942/g.18957 Transcript_8942/m.18957 type:complete len:228 (-) Transcript_8942:739-1422(-)
MPSPSRYASTNAVAPMVPHSLQPRYTPETVLPLPPPPSAASAFAINLIPREVISFSSACSTFNVTFSSMYSARALAPFLVISFPDRSRWTRGTSLDQRAWQTCLTPPSSRTQSRRLRYVSEEHLDSVPNSFADPSGPKELSAKSSRTMFLTLSPISSIADATRTDPALGARVPENRTSVSRSLHRCRMRAKAVHPPSPLMLLKKWIFDSRSQMTDPSVAAASSSVPS